MSKPRSRHIGITDSEFRTVRECTTAIHFGKQAKHLPGQPNHDSSKSTLIIGIQELQRLVELRAGTGRWVSANKEVVDFATVIGRRRDPLTGLSVDTARGTIHYSKSGVYVVPADPAAKKGKS